MTLSYICSFFEKQTVFLFKRFRCVLKLRFFTLNLPLPTLKGSRTCRLSESTGYFLAFFYTAQTVFLSICSTLPVSRTSLLLRVISAIFSLWRPLSTHCNGIPIENIFLKLLHCHFCVPFPVLPCLTKPLLWQWGH
jgi:hypothetical protein